MYAERACNVRTVAAARALSSKPWNSYLVDLCCLDARILVFRIPFLLSL